MAGGDENVMKSVIAIADKSRQALIAAGEDMPELAELLGIEAMMAEASAKETGAVQTAAANTAAPSAADGALTRLEVAVDISEQARQKFDENDAVFVYAKAKQGPRMPLAVERLTLAALPTTVVLDDSMAMVEGMNLSAFEQLVISARVTKTGSAIAQSGDFIGKQDVDAKNAAATLNILIDTVVP